MPLTQCGNILAHGQGLDRGVFSFDADGGDSLTWENMSSGKKLEVPNASVQEVHWRTIVSGCKLTLVLEANAVALFTGFKLKDKEVLAKYFEARCGGKVINEKPVSLKGQNLGKLETMHNELTLLDRDDHEVLTISLSRVKNVAVPLANEVRRRQGRVKGGLGGWMGGGGGNGIIHGRVGGSLRGREGRPTVSRGSEFALARSTHSRVLCPRRCCARPRCNCVFRGSRRAGMLVRLLPLLLLAGRCVYGRVGVACVRHHPDGGAMRHRRPQWRPGAVRHDQVFHPTRRGRNGRRRRAV